MESPRAMLPQFAQSSPRLRRFTSGHIFSFRLRAPLDDDLEQRGLINFELCYSIARLKAADAHEAPEEIERKRRGVVRVRDRAGRWHRVRADPLDRGKHVHDFRRTVD